MKQLNVLSKRERVISTIHGIRHIVIGSIKMPLKIIIGTQAYTGYRPGFTGNGMASATTAKVFKIKKYLGLA